MNRNKSDNTFSVKNTTDFCIGFGAYVCFFAQVQYAHVCLAPLHALAVEERRSDEQQ